MENMEILDPRGVWIKNNSQFAMPNPETGEVYKGQRMLKVKDSPWIKTQPVLEYTADPMAPEPPPAPPAPAGKASK